MRNTLIIAAVWVGICGPAMAGGKTFDEIFPATPSIEEWCSALPNNSVYRTNACVYSAQIDYDYDRIIWAALSPARREACGERWKALKTSIRVRYIMIRACLSNQLTAQDHEIGRGFETW